MTWSRSHDKDTILANEVYYYATPRWMSLRRATKLSTARNYEIQSPSTCNDAIVELFFNRDPGLMPISPEPDLIPLTLPADVRRGLSTAIPEGKPRPIPPLLGLLRETISAPIVDRVRGNTLSEGLGSGNPKTSSLPRIVECIVSSRSLAKSSIVGDPGGAGSTANLDLVDDWGKPPVSSSSTRPSFCPSSLVPRLKCRFSPRADGV